MAEQERLNETKTADAPRSTADAPRLTADAPRLTADAPRIDRPSKGLLEHVPVPRAMALAVQHVIAMVVGCITVPIIASTAAGLDNTGRVTMIQASLLAAGLAILIQSLDQKRFVGASLPLVVGSGFAFIAVMSSIGAHFGISAVFGAQFVAALFGIVFGLLYRYLQYIFTPVVKAVVVMTIGISLSATAVDYIAGSVNSRFYGTPKSWALGIFTLVVTLLYAHYGRGFIKRASTLMGLATGYIVALIFNLVHFESMEGQVVFQIPRIFHFGLSFHLEAIVPFMIIALISAVQDMGQIAATVHGLYGREPQVAEVRGGIIGDCVGTLFGSLFGGTPNAIAGQNVGIVVTTRVVARSVFVSAGLMLIVIGFFPIVSAAFLTIPYSVLGGATVAVFGSIATTGMKMLASTGMTPRNMSIAGLSLSLAIGITYHSDAFSRFPTWVMTIFGNAIVVATLAAILLNVFLPKEKEVEAKDQAKAQR